MSSVSEEDAYIVRVKRGPAFGIEEYSAKSSEEALNFAKTFFFGAPDLIQVVDREGSVVHSHGQVLEAWNEYCKNNNITQITVLI